MKSVQISAISENKIGFEHIEIRCSTKLTANLEEPWCILHTSENTLIFEEERRYNTPSEGVHSILEPNSVYKEHRIDWTSISTEIERKLGHLRYDI